MHQKEFERNLVDVVALSRQVCRIPVEANLKFATQENFLGAVIDGYQLEDPTALCVLLKPVSEDVCQLQNALNKLGFGLRIYDGYRPHRAVLDFVKRANAKEFTSYELERAKKYHPFVETKDLIPKGYVSDKSSHCHGNTLDTELVDLESGLPFFMGAPMSYMGKISHNDATVSSIKQEWTALKKIGLFDSIIKENWQQSADGINCEWQEDQAEIYIQRALYNRKKLAVMAKQQGFTIHPLEWWHLTSFHSGSPEPMDIPITVNLKRIGVSKKEQLVRVATFAAVALGFFAHHALPSIMEADPIKRPCL